MLCGGVIAGCTLGMAKVAEWFASIRGGESLLHIPPVKFVLDQGWVKPENADSALIWILAGLVVFLHIPKGLATFFNSYLVDSVANKVANDLRVEIYDHLQTLPLSFFHRSRIGDIMSRMSNDITIIQQAGYLMMQLIDAPITIVACLAMMFVKSWQLTVLTILFVPLMAVAIDKLTQKLRSLTTSNQKKLADVSAVIEESIRGVRIVKSFGMEEQESKRFRRTSLDSLSAALRVARRKAVVMPTVEFMGAIAAALIVLVGGWLMVRGNLGFPQLAAFILLSFVTAGAAKQLSRLNVVYQQVLAGSERIFELLDTRTDLIEDPDGVVLTDVEGSVEFRNVTFEYHPGEVVLNKLSFKLNPGEVIAIVGTSGAGKSTIADLIPRFYDVTDGQILVEEHDVRNINTRSLREQIAMVPQETILFSGTIADNISYGKPGADVAEIIEAAKAANAHEFVSQLPAGYNTVLGEGGVGLSGGQRQRIAIARALLKNPRILILDEATSSLDAASEGIVQDALDRLMQGRSTLVIAHRLSTVTGADRIIVLDKGQVVESGTFDELVASGGAFAMLYRTQFRNEEAAQTSG